MITYDEVITELAKGRGQAIALTVPIEEPQITGQILDLQDEISNVPGLGFVPEEELHILLKLAGFQVIQRTFDDDILREEVPRIDEQAAALFRSVSPFSVRIGRPNVFPDAVVLEVADEGALRRLHVTLMEHIPLLHRYPTDGPNYLPHVVIAFFYDASGLPALKAKLSGLRDLEVGTLLVRSVQLVRRWLMPAGPETDPIKTYYLR